MENIRDLKVTKACQVPIGQHFGLVYSHADRGRVRSPLVVPLGHELPDLSDEVAAIKGIFDRMPVEMDKRRTIGLAVLRLCSLDPEEAPRASENDQVWELLGGYLLAMEGAAPIEIQPPSAEDFNENGIGFVRSKSPAGHLLGQTINLPSPDYMDISHVVQLTGNDLHGSYGAIHPQSPETVIPRSAVWPASEPIFLH